MLKDKLDKLAMADKLDLNALFAVYVELRDDDRQTRRPRQQKANRS